MMMLGSNGEREKERYNASAFIYVYVSVAMECSDAMNAPPGML